jgi:uncharacterized protein YijF (DUF1287 family)
MKVTLYYPDKTTATRNVKNLTAWSEREKKKAPLGTILIAFSETGGTLQTRLDNRNYWTLLRRTYGP